MGNQGMTGKKQSGKRYGFFHISDLSLVLHVTVNRETPFLRLLVFLSRLS